MEKYKNLSGQRFGRLLVIERMQNNKHGKSQWRCRCDCGNEVVVVAGNLLSGNTTSCGCYRSELTAKKNKLNATHRKSNTRIYQIWTNMRRRCNSPTCDAYPLYGGRGITVCDTWGKDFTAFQDWALSHGYRENLTIDRIDNDKGYSPENCRWATVKEQNNNRSSNIFCEIDGMRKTLSQWAEYADLPKYTIYDRWHRGVQGHDLIGPIEKQGERLPIEGCP